MSALHAAFLLGQVEEAEAGLNGPEQRRRVDRLHHDRGNLHAALTWARGEGGPLEVRLAGALGRYWQLSGQYAEGRQWLQAAVSGVESRTPPTLLAKAVNALGTLEFL